MKKRVLMVLMAVTTLLSSCKREQESQTRIDNPTEKEVKLEIDGTAYTIPAEQFVMVDLDTGKHEMTVDGEESITFEKGENDDGAMLNPTHTEYITETIPYTDIPLEENHMYLHSIKTIELDGKEYEGVFKVLNDTYMPNGKRRTWKYGLDQEFPEEVEVEDNGSTYNLMYAKIYRKKDFIKMYEKEYAE